MDFYNDNEEMLAKLKTGASGYDLIVPSSYMVAIMKRLDMLEPIDYRAVPNARGVDTFFSNLPYDPGSVHSVPYASGVCGVMYNTEFVHDTVTSWRALWDKRYAGKILMVDDMRTAFLPAFALIHAQLRNRNKDDLRKAMDLLIEQKPLVKKYESNTIIDFLLNREVWIAQIWNGFAVRLAREHKEFRFALPSEQIIFFVDNLAVPRSSLHKDAAFRFIDFILRPENAARNMRKILYGMPYPAARAMLEPELRDSPIMFPAPPPGGDIDVPDDLGEFNESLERAWMEVKSR
jgi:spermidine/putrescine transport system substrate-binding protein